MTSVTVFAHKLFVFVSPFRFRVFAVSPLCFLVLPCVCRAETQTNADGRFVRSFMMLGKSAYAAAHSVSKVRQHGFWIFPVVGDIRGRRCCGGNDIMTQSQRCTYEGYVQHAHDIGMLR